MSSEKTSLKRVLSSSSSTFSTNQPKYMMSEIPLPLKATNTKLHPLKGNEDRHTKVNKRESCATLPSVRVARIFQLTCELGFSSHGETIQTRLPLRATYTKLILCYFAINVCCLSLPTHLWVRLQFWWDWDLMPSRALHYCCYWHRNITIYLPWTSQTRL